MLLIHDVVEIDAGDTFAYDAVGNQDKAQREQQAADRLFGLLPQDQALAYRALWDEFEKRQSAAARYAATAIAQLLHRRGGVAAAWGHKGAGDRAQ